MGRHLDVVVPILDEAELLPAPRWPAGVLDAPEVGPALARLLEHPSPRVRAFATRALGFLPASRPLEVHLDALEQDATLRVPAAEALARRGEDGARRRLLAMLAHDPSPATRVEALHSLASLRLEPAAVLPPLTAALADPATEVVDAAVRALLRLGRDARPALPALERLLDSAGRPVSTIVAAVISSLRDPGPGQAPGSA